MGRRGEQRRQPAISVEIADECLAMGETGGRVGIRYTTREN
jgi:hypothetical protein